MVVERIPVGAGDPVQGKLERRVVERVDLAAVAADEMVVMLAARLGRLKARHAMPEVDSVHKPKLREQFEHTVDARDADGATRRAEPIEQLLCGKAALLGGEVADHRVASPT